MNFLILKSIIEATIINFRCKDCWSGIVEWNLNILGTAGNSINMEVICPGCRTQWLIKAEIGLVNQMQMNNPDMMSNIKNTIKWIGQNVVSTGVSSDAIKDADILSIRENIKNSTSIEDLFNT